MDRILINDPGGLVSAHIALGHHFAEIGAFLRVLYCASACLVTLVYVPKDHVCFYPQAWIGYHSEKWTGGLEEPYKMRWERGREWIANKGYDSCLPQNKK